MQRAGQRAAILRDERRLVRRQREEREQLLASLAVAPASITPHDLEELVHRGAVAALGGVALRQRKPCGVVVAIDRATVQRGQPYRFEATHHLMDSPVLISFEAALP